MIEKRGVHQKSDTSIRQNTYTMASRYIVHIVAAQTIKNYEVAFTLNYDLWISSQAELFE